MTHTSSLSVAMCTCNGAVYVAQQLQSIAEQTRPPDEVVVLDDRSDDDTTGIIRAFARKTSFPVRLHCNEERVGWTKNFERAISLCRGDIIVLADQDDVWQPNKLARLEQVFGEHPSVGAAFSDAEVVDDELRPLGYRLWQAVGFNRADRQRAAGGKLVGVLLKRNVVTGATMAFRAGFRELVLPIPAEWHEDAHDAWIALLIAAVAEIAVIDEPLVLYRKHARQQIGATKKTIAGGLTRALADMSSDFPVYSAQGKENCAAALRRFVLAYERLIAKGGVTDGAGAMLQLKGKVAHFQVRAHLPENRWARLRIVSREWFTRHYHRYSRGLLSAAKDLVR